MHAYDGKPERRLFELLHGQDLRTNQDVTFLTDGGDSDQAAPGGDHALWRALLDWFHLAMRLTVLEQYAKGLAQDDPAEATGLLRLDVSSGGSGTATPIWP